MRGFFSEYIERSCFKHFSFSKRHQDSMSSRRRRGSGQAKSLACVALLTSSSAADDLWCHYSDELFTYQDPGKVPQNRCEVELLSPPSAAGPAAAAATSARSCRRAQRAGAGTAPPTAPTTSLTLHTGESVPVSALPEVFLVHPQLPQGYIGTPLAGLAALLKPQDNLLHMCGVSRDMLQGLNPPDTPLDSDAEEGSVFSAGCFSDAGSRVGHSEHSIEDEHSTGANDAACATSTRADGTPSMADAFRLDLPVARTGGVRRPRGGSTPLSVAAGGASAGHSDTQVGSLHADSDDSELFSFKCEQVVAESPPAPKRAAGRAQKQVDPSQGSVVHGNAAAVHQDQGATTLGLGSAPPPDGLLGAGSAPPFKGGTTPPPDGLLVDDILDYDSDFDGEDETAPSPQVAAVRPMPAASPQDSGGKAMAPATAQTDPPSPPPPPPLPVQASARPAQQAAAASASSRAAQTPAGQGPPRTPQSRYQGTDSSAQGKPERKVQWAERTAEHPATETIVTDVKPPKVWKGPQFTHRGNRTLHPLTPPSTGGGRAPLRSPQPADQEQHTPNQQTHYTRRYGAVGPADRQLAASMHAEGGVIRGEAPPPTMNGVLGAQYQRFIQVQHAIAVDTARGVVDPHAILHAFGRELWSALARGEGFDMGERLHRVYDEAGQLHLRYNTGTRQVVAAPGLPPQPDGHTRVVVRKQRGPYVHERKF